MYSLNQFIFVQKLSILSNQYLSLLLLLIASFVGVILVIPEIIRVVLGKKIFDAPGGRKIHVTQTPSMGGIGVFFSFILLALFCVETSEIQGINYFYVSITLLFFTGLRDDLLPIDSLKKLLLQVVAVLLVVSLCNVRIESMYSLDFFGLGKFPEWFSYPLTVFVIVILINAFNLIDGIDGLAGSIATLLSLILGIWFSVNGYWSYASLCIIMLGSLLGFLYYNWSPAKIFMGDTGSLIIGFFCTVMLIVFLKLNTEAQFQINNSISFTILLFIYPIFDTIRVIVLRVRRKKSPFSPDKRHIHLSLKRLGLSHRQITQSIIFTSLLLIIGHYLLSSIFNVNEIVLLVLIVLGCLLIHYALMQRIIKYKKDKKQIDITKLSISRVQVILKKRDN